MADDFPRIELLGTQGWLVRFTDRLDDQANRAAIAYRAAVETARQQTPEAWAGVRETASSLGSVLIRFEGDRDGPQQAAQRLLGSQDWAKQPLPPRRLWTIPCSFGGTDGPQLAEAADLAGVAEAEAIDALTAQSVRVLALGFAPGMPYLGILPPAWDIPRQSGLTPKVPEGALVVAVRQFVLFGTEAPTGWRQVGRTSFGCFRQGRDRPIALSPGDEVRFQPVTAEALREAERSDPSGHGGATVTMIP
ncbi:allophanate hydrolase subunit 1 [Jannaschia sp. AI_61]|nr:carboxyltransferase domain-containing protein [Jannaschia sp. AI_61]